MHGRHVGEVESGREGPELASAGDEVGPAAAGPGLDWTRQAGLAIQANPSHTLPLPPKVLLL